MENKDKEISREEQLIKHYEKIRLGGKYNMMTEMNKVMKILKCTEEEYMNILFNYEELCRKYKVRDI